MPKCTNPSFYGRCRKCDACLETRLRSWVLRMILESMMYSQDETTFLTLTYRNEDLPDDEEQAKDQLQKFFKRLRRDFSVGRKLRYVAALERGNQGTKRFHWHIILFGVRLSVSNRHFVRKKWGHGFVEWLPASPARMSYVCKYAIKGGVFLMSRRPGIGDGMVGYINHTISHLTNEEVRRIKDKSFTDYLLNRYILAPGAAHGGKFLSDRNPYARSRRTLQGLKIGGYYYPLHDFLKKRLTDMRKVQYGKKEEKP